MHQLSPVASIVFAGDTLQAQVWSPFLAQLAPLLPSISHYLPLSEIEQKFESDQRRDAHKKRISGEYGVGDYLSTYLFARLDEILSDEPFNPPRRRRDPPILTSGRGWIRWQDGYRDRARLLVSHRMALEEGDTGGD